MRVSESIEDDDLRNFTLLSMFKNDDAVDLEKKLGYVEALNSSQKYAAEANRIAGDMLKSVQRYDDAIAAYRAWGEEIKSNYIVADTKFLKGDVADASQNWKCWR